MARRAPSEWMERCLDALETKLKELGTEHVEGGTLNPHVCVCAKSVEEETFKPLCEKGQTLKKCVQTSA